MHILEQAITLDVAASQLWDFVATPNNLNQLTPPELDFKTVSEVPKLMHNGLTILYEIKIPFWGRRRWLTEIKHIREGVSFVDEQRIGPYRYWYHYHEVEALSDDCCRMIDRVHYQLPGEPFSLPLHALLVRRMLNDIFAYRSRRLKEIFPDCGDGEQSSGVTC